MDVKVSSEIIGGRDYFGESGRYGRVTLEYILKIGCQDIFMSPCSESGLVAG
jgi:hypothetical protein